MFKLCSKISISINCRRQLASKEPERVQSLSTTTMDTYFKEAPMENRVFTTYLVTDSFLVFLKAVCLHFQPNMKLREK